MQDLKPGYYWHKFFSEFHNEFIYRPIEVVEITKEASWWKGEYKTPGFYVLSLGDTWLRGRGYYDDFSQAEYIPLEEPK